MSPGLESRPGSVSASTVLHNRVGAHNGASRWTPNRAPWPKFSLAGLGPRPRFLPSTYLEVACAEITVPIATSTLGCWGEQNETDFADVKSCLPGRLAIHREQSDEADAAIRRGIVSPVLVVGRVVCVCPPRLHERRWYVLGRKAVRHRPVQKTNLEG